MRDELHKPSKVVIRDFQIKDYNALLTLWDSAKLSYRPKGRDRKEKIERELSLGTTIFLVAGVEAENSLI